MLKTDLLQFRLELILGDDWWHNHQLKSSCCCHRDGACSSQEPSGNLQDLDLSCGYTKGCVETEDFGIPSLGYCTRFFLAIWCLYWKAWQKHPWSWHTLRACYCLRVSPHINKSYQNSSGSWHSCQKILKCRRCVCNKTFCLETSHGKTSHRRLLEQCWWFELITLSGSSLIWIHFFNFLHQPQKKALERHSIESLSDLWVPGPKPSIHQFTHIRDYY
jgi:hypothetical protein